MTVTVIVIVIVTVTGGLGVSRGEIERQVKLSDQVLSHGERSSPPSAKIWSSRQVLGSRAG